MLHASGLLTAGTVGFEQYLKMSSPVGFEVADSVMDLLHPQPSAFASSALLRVLAREELLHTPRPLPYDAALPLCRISDVSRRSDTIFVNGSAISAYG
jgi:hypothetical protein